MNRPPMFPGGMMPPMGGGKGPMMQRPPANLAPGGPRTGMPPGKPTQIPGQMGMPMPRPDEPLSASALASAPAGMQKQMLGEKLFPRISRFQPELAGKITGMMLEMDNSELLMLLEGEQLLKAKVDEVMKVLENMK